MRGEAETMYNQITFIISAEKHRNILSMHLHLTKFRKSEKRKNKTLKIVNEYYAIVPKLLFFKTTDLYIVYLFSEYADN